MSTITLAEAHLIVQQLSEKVRNPNAVSFGKRKSTRLGTAHGLASRYQYLVTKPEVGIASKVEDTITDHSNRVREGLTEYVKLVDVLYRLRVSISKANKESGVDSILNELASVRLQIETFEDIIEANGQKSFQDTYPRDSLARVELDSKLEIFQQRKADVVDAYSRYSAPQLNATLDKDVHDFISITLLDYRHSESARKKLLLNLNNTTRIPINDSDLAFIRNLRIIF